MEDKKEGVRAVDRAIDILQAFSYEESSLTLAQLCARVDLPKTTVFRSLQTMMQRGLLRMDEQSGKYHLGYELIKLGAIAQVGTSLVSVAKDEMQKISRASDQTCNLYVRDGLERHCIAQVASAHYIRRYSFLGARHPLYCGAGKILLAFADEEFQNEYFHKVKLERFTENTVTDARQLRAELAEIRRNGYSVTIGERDAATAMVSCPLFDYTGKIVAAITISGPVYCFGEESLEGYIRMLKDSADRISQELGYIGS